MKPHIYWYDSSVFICQIPDHKKPTEPMTDDEYYAFVSCGAGKTMRESYEDWLRDCGK